MPSSKLTDEPLDDTHNPSPTTTPLAWILEYSIAHPKLATSSAPLVSAVLCQDTRLCGIKSDDKLSKLLFEVRRIRYFIDNLGELDCYKSLHNSVVKIEKLHKACMKSLILEGNMTPPQVIAYKQDFKTTLKLYQNISLKMKKMLSEFNNEAKVYGEALRQLNKNVEISGYLYGQLYVEDDSESSEKGSNVDDDIQITKVTRVIDGIHYNRIESIIISQDISNIQLKEMLTKYMDIAISRILNSKPYRDHIYELGEEDTGDELLSKVALSRISRKIRVEKHQK